MSVVEFGSALEAGEVLRVIEVDEPAPGNGWSLTVPGEFHWRIISVFELFTTDATVGDRYPLLILFHGTREVQRLPGGIVLPASEGLRLTWAAGLGASVGSLPAAAVSVPLPLLPLEPGLTLTGTSVFMGGGDQISDVTVLVAERFTGDRPPDQPPSAGLVTPVDLEAKIQP